MNEDHKNEYGILIAKKSEKLVTALYLVTDLIVDLEPMKGTLRGLGVELLSSMNTLAQTDVKDRIKEYKMSLRLVTETVSLLHVARTAGIVSEMNCTLLIDGFRSLQLVLEKKQPVLSQEMLTIDGEHRLGETESLGLGIQNSSFDALTPRALQKSDSSIKVDHKKEGDLEVEGGSKIIELQSAVRKVSAVASGAESNSAREHANSSTFRGSYKGHNSAGGEITRHTPMLTSYQQRKVSRRDQILALFVRGVDVSIKDISMRIRGCSEKTIQRELNALVFDNKIARIGEKRWSRYLLK